MYKWILCYLQMLLTDADMLPVVEKDIRGGKYHAAYWHAKNSNKYMKDNDQNIESSYLMN